MCIIQSYHGFLGSRMGHSARVVNLHIRHVNSDLFVLLVWDVRQGHSLWFHKPLSCRHGGGFIQAWVPAVNRQGGFCISYHHHYVNRGAVIPHLFLAQQNLPCQPAYRSVRPSERYGNRHACNQRCFNAFKDTNPPKTPMSAIAIRNDPHTLRFDYPFRTGGQCG